MAEHIAQALDRLPVDLRRERQLVIREVLGGLPDHEEVPLDGSERRLHEFAVARLVAPLKEGVGVTGLAEAVEDVSEPVRGVSAHSGTA